VKNFARAAEKARADQQKERLTRMFEALSATNEAIIRIRDRNTLFQQVCEIAVERTGALLVAWTDEERDSLPTLKDKAERNGYHACEIVGAEEVYRRVPHLGPGALERGAGDRPARCPQHREQGTSSLPIATRISSLFCHSACPGVGVPHSPPRAREGQGALGTQGCPRGADARPEFHQGGVEFGRLSRRGHEREHVGVVTLC
jgi:hypothetical protein